MPAIARRCVDGVGAGGGQTVMPVRFANGSDGPVDSRSECGNRRGNDGQLTECKLLFVNDL